MNIGQKQQIHVFYDKGKENFDDKGENAFYFIFIGYSDESKANRLYNPNSSKNR